MHYRVWYSMVGPLVVWGALNIWKGTFRHIPRCVYHRLHGRRCALGLLNLFLAHTDLMSRLEGVCFGHVLRRTLLKHTTIVDSVSIGTAFRTQHTIGTSMVIVDVDGSRSPRENNVLSVFCLMLTEVTTLIHIYHVVVGPNVCLALALFHVWYNFGEALSILYK